MGDHPLRCLPEYHHSNHQYVRDKQKRKEHFIKRGECDVFVHGGQCHPVDQRPQRSFEVSYRSMDSDQLQERGRIGIQCVFEDGDQKGDGIGCFEGGAVGAAIQNRSAAQSGKAKEEDGVEKEEVVQKEELLQKEDSVEEEDGVQKEELLKEDGGYEEEEFFEKERIIEEED